MSLKLKIQHTALVTWIPLSHFCMGGAAGSYCHSCNFQMFPPEGGLASMNSTDGS